MEKELYIASAGDVGSSGASQSCVLKPPHHLLMIYFQRPAATPEENTESVVIVGSASASPLHFFLS